MTAPRWCSHCDVDRSQRRDGICQACNAYRHKYGQLPPDDVLRRRIERRETARLEDRARRAAWAPAYS